MGEGLDHLVLDRAKQATVLLLYARFLDSDYAPASARPEDVSAHLSNLTANGPPITLSKKTLSLSVDELNTLIRKRFVEKHKVDARGLQVDTVQHLLRGEDVFVLAGMGYGKTRMAKEFGRFFPKKSKSIILIINPLDALGDNQVRFLSTYVLANVTGELSLLQKKQVAGKIRDGYTAINLTALNFTRKAARDIEMGKYQYIYIASISFGSVLINLRLRHHKTCFFWIHRALKYF